MRIRTVKGFLILYSPGSQQQRPPRSLDFFPTRKDDGATSNEWIDVTVFRRPPHLQALPVSCLVIAVQKPCANPGPSAECRLR